MGRAMNRLRRYCPRRLERSDCRCASGFAEQKSCCRNQYQDKPAEDPPFEFAERIGIADGRTNAASGLISGCARRLTGAGCGLLLARHGTCSGNAELKRLAGNSILRYEGLYVRVL